MRRLFIFLGLFGGFAALGIGAFFWLEGQETRAYQAPPETGPSLPQLQFEAVTPLNSTIACLNRDLPAYALGCRTGSPLPDPPCVFPQKAPDQNGPFDPMIREFIDLRNANPTDCDAWDLVHGKFVRVHDSLHRQLDPVAAAYWEANGMELPRLLQQYMELARGFVLESRDPEAKPGDREEMLSRLNEKRQELQEELEATPEPGFYGEIGEKARNFYEAAVKRSARLNGAQPFSPSEVRMIRTGEAHLVKGSPEDLRLACNELIRAYNGRNPALALQPGGVYLFYLNLLN